MKKASLLPLLLAAAAILLGGVVGPYWYWSKAATLINRAAADRKARVAKARDERRAQGWDFWTIEIDNLTSELKEEKAKLRSRSDELDRRAARIEAEKQELERLREDIEGMRRELDGRVIAIGADESKNLKTLAQTYATIQPDSVVAIIRQMNDTTVVKILALMKPDVVGPIFESMAKQSANDPSLAQLAAQLSDKLRLMKSNSPNPGGVTSN